MSIIKRSTPRVVKITKNINPYSKGSAIVEFGNTKIHVTATIEEELPRWIRGSGKGWVTAEYSMLPSSTHSRIRRERGKVKGRTLEIERLIARSLRAVVDMEKLGERLITLDCDVLVADGGTRTASITGGYVALEIAVKGLLKEGVLTENPLNERVAAVSVGIDTNGEIIADLNYEEDSSCSTDMNIVMTRSGKLVEIQGTAEKNPFSREDLNALLKCGEESLSHIFEVQEKVFLD